MSIVDDIFKAAQIAATRNEPFDKYEVTVSEYVELSYQVKEWFNPKPSPPIKAYSSHDGFFSSGSSVEYDYHAPEYLASLNRWRAREDSIMNNYDRKLVLNGPVGPIEIVIKSNGGW